MSVDLNWSLVAPVLLIAGGLLIAGAGAIKPVAGIAIGYARGWLERSPDPVKRSSDEQPPDGFTDHVMTILQACPSAPYETRLAYVIDGLTEAQTLRREVERLGSGSSLNGGES